MLAILAVLAANGDGVDVNVNLITLLAAVIGLLVVAPTWIRGKRAQAQLEAKDKIISTNEQSIRAMEASNEQHEHDKEFLRQKMTRFEAENHDLAREASHWKTRFEEQEKYTAPQAFNELTDLLRANTETLGKAVETLDTIATRLVENGHGRPRS